MHAQFQRRSHKFGSSLLHLFPKSAVLLFQQLAKTDETTRFVPTKNNGLRSLSPSWEKQLCKTDTHFPQTPALQRRVRGLPIGDCAGSSNNLVPTCLNLIAIEVTEKTFFERLYLVTGLVPIFALNQLPICSHPPTVLMPAISRFL
jgi:hypothetical protein